jgi:DNA gyrase subunit A
MSEETTGKLIPVAVEDEVKTAYLNYAMSVIVSRALPDVRDGLKPVHRRLLFSMDELGLRPNAQTKKSARITGDTMGKYHPHGDLALYDALVRMAQDFSLRYPLVHGQGNFGSIDGDPPAASRYTEAKLARPAEEMLADLGKETVDFVPNYDESLKEPSVLPSAFPNLLVNGSSGIAVGMATNMAPHNLGEVVDAICAYIDNPEVSIEELTSHIRGPDFPTGGIIFGTRGIKDAYRTGKGKIVVRGKFAVELTKTNKEAIVFTEIPYNVNKAQLIIRIADLVRDKVIDGVADLRDESDREGMRIYIELKRGAVAKVILNQLFSHTALQSTFGVNNLALVEGRPKLLNLKELVHYFVKHRIEVVTRRTRFDLRKAEERAHILEGLYIAVKNIDEVVEIIKTSKDVDEAKRRLIARFNLSEVQSQAIVDLRLGRLTALEVNKIEAELNEVRALIEYLKKLLADDSMKLKVVRDETQEIARKYGDKRRTEIVPDEVEEINIEDLIKKEEMVILISNKGFVKRVPVSAYKSQGRGGKGSNSANLIEDDFLKQLFIASTHDYVLFVSSLGKAYYLKVHEIPEASRAARGTHIKALLQISADEEITTVISFKDFSSTSFIFMATARGVVKKVQTDVFMNAKTRGIIALHLDEGDRLVSALLTSGNDEIVLITRQGNALRIKEGDVRAMGRSSRGVTGIKLDKEDELAGILTVDDDRNMLIISEFGYGKRTEFNNFSPHGRATRGQMIYVPSEKTGEIIGTITVKNDDEVVVITSQGKTLKISADTISVLGKTAQGVRIVNIERPDFVVGLGRVQKDEVTDESLAEDADSLKTEQEVPNTAAEAPEEEEVEQKPKQEGSEE